MKTRTIHKTKILDIAAYLWVEGFQCISVKRLGLNHAEFSFDDPRGHALSVVTRFQSGGASAKITDYLYARSQLKIWVRALPLSFPRTSLTAAAEEPQGTVTVSTGYPYWYVEGGHVWHALFGDKAPHTVRFQTGNFYRTKAEAEQHLRV